MDENLGNRSSGARKPGHVSRSHAPRGSTHFIILVCAERMAKVPTQRDCVKTNTSVIVIPTKVGIQLIFAGYGRLSKKKKTWWDKHSCLSFFANIGQARMPIPPINVLLRQPRHLIGLFTRSQSVGTIIQPGFTCQTDS